MKTSPFCAVAATAALAALSALSVTPAQADGVPPAAHQMFVQGGKDLDAKRYQAAIDDYTQSLQMGDDGANIYYCRGLAERKLGQQQGDSNTLFRAAVADFNRSVAEGDTDYDTYFQRAFARMMYDAGGSLADWNQCLHLDPSNADAYYNRGLVHHDTGDRAAAIADMKRAAQLYRAAHDPSDAHDALTKLADYSR